MIDDVNRNPDKSVRNALLLKVLKGSREITLPAYQEPEQPTTTSDIFENGKAVVKPDPCGLKHMYREKRLRALAEKGNQDAINILNSGEY